MSLKNALKGMFWEPDTTAPEAAPVQAHTPAPIISNQPSAPVVSVDTQKVDQALQQKLTGAIHAANIAGYKVFDDMLDSLEDVVPDVNMRYKKTLEICAKQGHTLPVLLNDIDRVIGVLDDESRAFEADQKRQFQNSVGALTQSVETANKLIAESEQQLQALQGRLEDLRKQRDTDAAAIGSAQSKIDQVNLRFTAVSQALMSEVQSQRAAVEQRMKVQS